MRDKMLSDDEKNALESGNESMMQKMIGSLVKAEEEIRYKDFRDKGIISDVVLVMNPGYKGVIEQALYSAGIKRIPIIYLDYVEPGKAYAITDKDVVENLKKNDPLWKETSDPLWKEGETE